MAYKNIEDARAYIRKWRAENRDKVRAWGRKYSAKNRDKMVSYTRNWRKANPEKHRATQLRAKGFRREMRLKILSHYSGGIPICNCCGTINIEFLTIDHLNNNGSQERRQLNGDKFYRYLINNSYPPDYQILCMNCNFSNGKYGYCPHQQRGLNE